MKIERVNENQIKCLLNKNDLSARNINIETLTYGTEEANKLFNEVLEQARSKFDFFPENAPLIIEAIPLKGDNLSITFTKSEDPEELDTRFSKFTPTPEDVESAVKEAMALTTDKLNKANEILNLLSSFKDALLNQAMLNNANTQPVSNERNKTNPHETKNRTDDIMLVFVFENIDKLISLCKILAPKYHGKSFVYRRNTEFYLLINNSEHTPEEFNQICNIICEYGAHTNLNKNTKAYFSEHYETILENDAISQLATL